MMISHGKFNTNAEALKQRIIAHEKYGFNDLNEWIFGHMDLKEGLSVLDVGCGTGKQTLPLAKIVGPRGRVTSADISKEALKALSDSARAQGLEGRITLLNTDLDKIGSHIQDMSFDRVLSSYSLYYAKDTQAVFKALFGAIKDGGILFFCGPSKDNNDELKKFHYDLTGGQKPADTEAAIFMEATGMKTAEKLFSDVRVSRFENPLRFDSAESLYSYWSSYNLYDEGLDGEFKNAAKEYFKNNTVFETAKRVIGIRAVK